MQRVCYSVVSDNAHVCMCMYELQLMYERTIKRSKTTMLTIVSSSVFLAASVFLRSSSIRDTFDAAPSRSMRSSSVFALSDDTSW